MSNLSTKMTRTFNRLGLKMKKHSPEILVTAGIVGVVASAVMACRATTKLDGILKNREERIKEYQTAVEHPEMLKEGTTYTVADAQNDIRITNTKTGIELVKLYAPAVALGTVSIISILASHKILNKRNVGLAAAYAAVDRGFKDYRSRVIERLGKEVDHELLYNIKRKEVEEKVVDENGEEKVVTKTVDVAEVSLPNNYTLFFDESCTGWSKDAELNKYFLLEQQSLANKMLLDRGHLFLNEVYDLIGKERTAMGSQVGWFYDKENPHLHNYVDFGIFDQTGIEKYDERKRAFVNGHERSIMLTPNVDGVIYDFLKD